MAIKKTRTIAEYVIRKWLQENHFDIDWFHLEMNGEDGILTDNSGDMIKLRYDRHSKQVIVL